jgi:hypothetical protein
MNEQEVAHWLERALADLRLRVQVKAQPLQDSPGDYALVVMLNRPCQCCPQLRAANRLVPEGCS